MSFVGVGVGFNMGAATGYLFVDAAGVRRGLDQAQGSFEQFQSKVQARSAQATRAMNAAASAQQTAILGAAQTTSRLQANQQAVVAATANASAQITRSYEQRGNAIASLGRVTQAENARIQAAEAKAAALTKKRDDLAAKIQSRRDLRALATDPAQIQTLNKQVAGLTRAYNQAVKDAGNASRSLAQIRRSASANIATEVGAATRAVDLANRAQVASTQQAISAIARQTNDYKRLAKGQGAAAEAVAQRVAIAGRKQIEAIQALEVAQRRVAAAQNRVTGLAAVGQDNTEAVKELERATEARDRAITRSVAARNRQVATEAAASATLAKIHARNEANAQKEADKLVRALAQEEAARRAAINQNLQRVTGAVAAVGLATAAAAAAGIREFARFDEAIHNVAAISDNASFALNTMRDAVLDLGVATGQAPVKLTNALYDIVSSGFDGADALTILDTSARAAVAGLSDVATSGKAFTAVLNAYKGAAEKVALTIADVGHVSDVAFQAVKDGVFTFEELTQQQGDNLSLAAELNVSYEELASAYVVLTRKGNNLSESTTQINGIMRTFLKPNEDLAAAIRSYGEEVLHVKNLTGAALVTQFGFGQALQFVNDVTDNNADALGRLFPNIRALRGEVALSGEGLKFYNEELKTLKNSSAGVGATQRTLAVQMKSLNFQLRQARESLRVAGISIGSSLAPGIAAAAHAAGALGSILATLNATTHGLFGTFLGFTGTALLATGVLIRIGAAAKGTVVAMKALRQLGVFEDMIAGGRRFAVVINTLIARMRAFIAVSTLAKVGVAAGLAALALGAIAFVTYKVIKAHQKEGEEVKKLTKLYQELNAEASSPSVRQNPERSAQLKAEQELLTRLTAGYDDFDTELQRVVDTANRMSDALLGPLSDTNPARQPGEIVDPASLVGPRARFGPQKTTIDALVSRIKDARLSADEIKQIVEIVDDLLKQTGIDSDAALKAVDDLVLGYERAIHSGSANANTDEKLIETLGNLKNQANLYREGLVGASEATDDLSDYTEDASEKGERLRQGLIATKDSLLQATGAMEDAQDPLSVLTHEFGQTGDSAYDMLLRLDSLRDVKLDDLAARGVKLVKGVNDAFLGLDLSPAQRQVVSVLRDLDNATKGVQEAKDAIDKHTQAAADLANTQQLVVDTVGTEGDGYAKLKKLLDDGLISQDEFNQAKQAAIFLYNDSAQAIEKENAATATGLIALADRTAKQRAAQDAYAGLTDEQKTFADSLQNENFLMAINLVLMAQLLAAQGRIPPEVPFNIATNLAEVVPGFAQFVNDTEIFNGRKIETRLSLRVDPALKSLDGIDKAIASTRENLRSLADVIEANRKAGKQAPDGLLAEQEQAKQHLADLLALRQETIDAMTSDTTTFDATGMPGIPSQEDVKQAQNDWTQIATFFKEPTAKADEFGQQVQNAIAAAEDLKNPLADLSDPVAFLNKQFGITEGKLSSLLLEAGQHDIIDLDQSQRHALRLQQAIEDNEKALASLNDEIDKHKQKQTEWSNILDLVDETLGKQEDGYDRLYQLRAANLITDQELIDIQNAGIVLRDRANRGVLEERAAIAKSLPALASYTLEHDKLNQDYEDLPANEKGFLAALKDEAVQAELNTFLMLKMLEAMNAIPKGTAARFALDTSAVDPVFAALVDDLHILEGPHDIPLDTSGTAEKDIDRLITKRKRLADRKAEFEIALKNGDKTQAQVDAVQEDLNKTDNKLIKTYIAVYTGHALEDLQGIQNVVLSIDENGNLVITAPTEQIARDFATINNIPLDERTVLVGAKEDPENPVDAQLPPAETTTTVKATVTGEQDVTAVGHAVAQMPSEKNTTVTVTLQGADVVIEQLTNLQPEFAKQGLYDGIIFDANFAAGLVNNLPLIADTFPAITKQLLVVGDIAQGTGYFGGRQFDAGIVRGVIDGQGAVAAAARYIAAVMLFEMISRLGIHSPSTEAASIGKFTTIGFAQGALSEAPAAAAAATQVARTAGEAMRTEAERQRQLLADANLFASNDLLSNTKGGIVPIGGNISVRDLTSIPKVAGIPLPASQGPTQVHQNNQITVPISGAGDPALVAKHVYREINSELTKLIKMGAQP